MNHLVAPPFQAASRATAGAGSPAPESVPPMPPLPPDFVPVPLDIPPQIPPEIREPDLPGEHIPIGDEPRLPF